MEPNNEPTSSDNEPSTSNKDPLDILLQSMEFLEQYADSVVSYSSRYNSTYSFSYSPDNLTGKARKYPQYGDFADTFMLVSYLRLIQLDNLAYKQNYCITCITKEDVRQMVAGVRSDPT